MTARTDWFQALGKPVSRRGHAAALALLIDSGLDAGEANITLNIVEHEVRHDNPDRAQKTLRRFLNDDETFVMRTLATLCSPDPNDDPESLLVTFWVSQDGEKLHPLDSEIGTVRFDEHNGEPDFTDVHARIERAVRNKFAKI